MAERELDKEQPAKSGSAGTPPNDAAGSDGNRPRESPGGRPLGAIGIAGVTLYLVIVAVVVIHGLVVLWPPSQEGPEKAFEGLEARLDARIDRLEQALAGVSERRADNGQPAPPAGGEAAPGGTAPGTGEPAEPATGDRDAQGAPPGAEDGATSAPTTSRGEMESDACRCQEGQTRADYAWWTFCLFPEERLFVIVLLAGALGGLVHSLRSFYWYLGNRKLYRSWVGMYVTLPVVGAALAVIFYLVARAGFSPPDAQFDRTNPFGFAALAVLVGMFTEQAAVRLKQVAETVMSKAQTGKDHVGAPTLTGIKPARGSTEGGETVTITGSGFAIGAEVRFGNRLATDVTLKSDTEIEAKTPSADSPGSVPIQVSNPDGGKADLPDGFTFEEPAPASR